MLYINGRPHDCCALEGITSPDASIGGQPMRWTFDAIQHDLLASVLAELRKMNTQLAEITGNELTDTDVAIE